MAEYMVFKDREAFDAAVKEEMRKNFRKLLEETVAEMDWEVEQAEVDRQWNRMFADANPSTGVRFEVPLGYIKGEKKTYERVYDIDRNQDVWVRLTNQGEGE